MVGVESGRRRVFIVEGRDEATSVAARAFLRALDLRPVEWEEAIRATEQTQPHLKDVVLAGMRLSDAVLVLYTGDDVVRLRPELVHDNDDSIETEERVQPRANVLYEAGIAEALHPARTVVVEFGNVKLFSDIGGVHNVRFDGTMQSRQRWVDRLKAAGLAVDDRGVEWFKAGDFPPPRAAVATLSSGSPADEIESSHDRWISELAPQRYAVPPWASMGGGAELTLRVCTALPGEGKLLQPTSDLVTQLRGERREDLLAQLLEDSALTAWLQDLKPVWHWKDSPVWEPYGSGSPEFTDLIWQPDWSDGRQPRIMAHAAVQTGRLPNGGAGLQLVCDLAFNVLELDDQREPGDVRWGTLPGPAPGALALREIVDCLAMLLTTPTIAVVASVGLIDNLPETAVEQVGMFFWSIGQRLDAVMNLQMLTRRAGSSDSGQQFQPADAPTLATISGRRRIATELLADLLEGAGYRGFTEVLDRLVPAV